MTLLLNNVEYLLSTKECDVMNLVRTYQSIYYCPTLPPWVHLNGENAFFKMYLKNLQTC